MSNASKDIKNQFKWLIWSSLFVLELPSWKDHSTRSQCVSDVCQVCANGMTMNFKCFHAAILWCDLGCGGVAGGCMNI